MRRKTAVPNCSANVIAKRGVRQVDKDRDQRQLIYVAGRPMNVCAPPAVIISLQNVNSRGAPTDKHYGHSISNDTFLAIFALTLPFFA